jgi:hypothetical protein
MSGTGWTNSEGPACPRLDGTALDLEHDRDCHSVCAGGACNGAWVLYRDSRYAGPAAEYLDEAMEQAEQDYDRALRAAELKGPS